MTVFMSEVALAVRVRRQVQRHVVDKKMAKSVP